MPSSGPKSLPSALQAERIHIATPSGGDVAVYIDTRIGGRPLLLLHSINAAPSAMEMKPLFDHYRQFRPVYAPDLPGFGISSRADVAYCPTLYVNALLELIEDLDLPALDVVALSTTAEFAARAANSAPERFSSLTLISPTGLGSRTPPSEKTRDRMQRFFRTPLVGAGLYRILTTRLSIRFFLNQAFEGEAPSEMIDYAHDSARQPAAQFAPYCFLSGQLFSPDACETLYEKLQVPTLILYDKDPNISFEKLPQLLTRNPLCTSARIAPTRGLPHWEQLGETTRTLDRFWSGTTEGGR